MNAFLPVFIECLSSISKQTGSIQVSRHFIDLYFTLSNSFVLLYSVAIRTFLLYYVLPKINSYWWHHGALRQEQCYNNTNNWTLIGGQGNNSIIVYRHWHACEGNVNYAQFQHKFW